MLTATKDLMFPATVTGSWPRPWWLPAACGGGPSRSALPDVKFREQFLDAVSSSLPTRNSRGSTS